jgi:hypothetical protein
MAWMPWAATIETMRSGFLHALFDLNWSAISEETVLGRHDG